MKIKKIIISFSLALMIPALVCAADYGKGKAKYATVKLPDSAAVYEKEYFPETDDAIGVFTAIYKANFFGGGTVVLKEKTYLLDQTILLNSKVRLKGAGVGKTILRRGPSFDQSTDAYLLGSKQGGISDAILMDLTVDGAYTPQELNGKEENPLLGIFFNSETAHNIRLLFDRIEVKGCSMGIHLKGCTHVTVQNSDIHDNGGIYLYHNIYYRRVGQALFQNNKIYNSVIGSGLKLAGGTNNVANESRYFTIINNEIYNNERINLNIQGCNDMLIEGNLLTQQYSTTSKMGALYMVEYGGYKCENTDIINNVIKDNINNGFYVKDCNNFNIEGNATYDNGTNYNLLSNSSFTCDYNTNSEFTSVDKIMSEREQGIKMFPNPVLDQVTIEGNVNSTIWIFNAKGSKVYEDMLRGDKHSIALQHLDKGIYIISLQDGAIKKTGIFIKE